MEENITTNCGKLPEEFNLKKELRKIYEEELIGKTNAGRIYRKLLFRDREFIKKLKEEFKTNPNVVMCWEEIIDELAGDKLKWKVAKLYPKEMKVFT